MDNPLVQPDPGLFIWTILTFLVLVGLLAKFAWRPLLEALERRQATIAKALDDAKLARQELERLQKESAEMMRQARVEAEAIIARSRTDAEALREELKQRVARRGGGDREERRTADPARDGTRDTADSPRGGRSVGHDRLEDPPAPGVEGGQRGPDRGHPEAGRSPAQLTRVTFTGHRVTETQRNYVGIQGFVIA